MERIRRAGLRISLFQRAEKNLVKKSSATNKPGKRLEAKAKRECITRVELAAGRRRADRRETKARQYPTGDGGLRPPRLDALGQPLAATRKWMGAKPDRRRRVSPAPSRQTGAMTPMEVCQGLGLYDLKNRVWHIQGACALKGEGLYEGLDWLASSLKELQAAGRPTSIGASTF
ncbi:ADP-ribosylation factor 1 [Platanthera guangdongensis]|uniref:ADP-ribosylation factor 1 n=1 Tax=Platanthera guangdongensis TaxID=2320717 RepID=A0ABR2LNB1_9ASPA